MSILVFNAGSSTLKFALFDSTALTELLSGVFSWSGDGHSAALSIRKYASLSVSETTAEVADYREAVSWVFSWLRDHGFRSPEDVW